MNELIALVTQKAGISSEQATTSVQTVLTFLKEKLPAGIGSQVEGVLGGSSGEGAGDIVKKLSGMFGS